MPSDNKKMAVLFLMKCHPGKKVYHNRMREQDAWAKRQSFCPTDYTQSWARTMTDIIQASAREADPEKYGQLTEHDKWYIDQGLYGEGKFLKKCYGHPEVEQSWVKYDPALQKKAWDGPGLPPGVNADESIKLLRGCDRNYEDQEDGLKLSAMESLELRFFEVAKAAHVTDKSSLHAAEAANGYLFIKACFEQLQPPREPNVTIAEHQVTIAKHHNMLRLVGPSKSGKSELAKLLARLYVASVDMEEDRLEGRWLEMDQILPDTSERSVWIAEVLGQPIKIWGPLKYLWHLAKKKPEARFALIMPEANRGDLFNILNRHWFEPRNRLGVSASKLPDAAPPVNLCIIFTENPVTANGAYQVMGGDEALGTRLTRDQTAAVEHGREIDDVLVGKVEDGLCNPKLRFDMSNFAQFFVRNHHVDAADANDLAWLASTHVWKSTFDSADPATTMPDFFEMTSKLHVGDQHRIADRLCRYLRAVAKKRKREEEAAAARTQRLDPATPVAPPPAAR